MCFLNFLRAFSVNQIAALCSLRSSQAGQRVGGARVTGEGSGWFVLGSLSRET